MVVMSRLILELIGFLCLSPANFNYWVYGKNFFTALSLITFPFS